MLAMLVMLVSLLQSDLRPSTKPCVLTLFSFTSPQLGLVYDDLLKIYILK